MKKYSPDGEFEERRIVPIYKGTRYADLPNGWYAANAQVLYGLLKSGVPGNDPQLQKSVVVLTNFLDSFGYPDATEDLAWLVALYVNLPQDDKYANKVTTGLVAKLLSGASVGGRNEGLWGPICVNPEFVKELTKLRDRYLEKKVTPLDSKMQTLDNRIKYLRAAEEAANKANNKKNGAHKKRKKRSPEHDKLWRQRERLKVELDKVMIPFLKISDEYKLWALSGRVNTHARARFSISGSEKGTLNGQTLTNLNIPGLYHNVYKYYVSDVQSTAIALFALKEAAKNNMIPSMINGPTNYKGRRLCSPIKTKNIFRSTQSALRKIGYKKLWNSYNISVQEHKLSSKLSFLHEFPEDVYKPVIGGGEHWGNQVDYFAALSYLTALLPETSTTDLQKSLKKEGGRVAEALKVNILNAPEEMGSRSGADYYHCLEMLRYSSNPRNDWNAITEALLSNTDEDYQVESTGSKMPRPNELTALAEEKHIDKGGSAVAAMKVAKLKIDRDNMLNLYEGLTDRAGLMAWLNAEPSAPLFVCWDPSREYEVKPAFTLSVRELKKKQKHIEVRYADTLEIQKLRNSPFVYVSETVTKDDLKKNQKVLKEYILTYKGSVLFSKHSSLVQKQMFAKLLKLWGVEFDRKLPDSGGDGLTLYTGNDKQLFMVRLTTSQSEDKKTRLKQLASLLYQVPKLKFEDGYWTGNPSKISSLAQGVLERYYDDEDEPIDAH